jgi:hypothetical protein
MIRRALLVVFWLLIVLFIINRPANAAHTAIAIAHAFAATIRALSRFASFL